MPNAPMASDQSVKAIAGRPVVGEQATVSTECAPQPLQG